jgi:hypothetical protein
MCVGAAATDASLNSDDGMTPVLNYDIGTAPPLRLFGKNYTVACASANGGVKLFAPPNPAYIFECPTEQFLATAIPSTNPAGIYAFYKDLDSSIFALSPPIPGYSNARLNTMYCESGRELLLNG